MVKRIHAHYLLELGAEEAADDEVLEKIERVHGFHAERCPVARSIRDAIVVTTSYELVSG